MATPRLGKQKPRYKFFLNPYTDARFTSCPGCGGKTKQRKLPVVIHVDSAGLTVLNRTCRFCPYCELLIIHQDEFEAQLAALFAGRAPEVVGNDYLVVGTLDRSDWRRSRKGAVTAKETIEALHDFKDVLRFTPPPSWAAAK